MGSGPTRTISWTRATRSSSAGGCAGARPRRAGTSRCRSCTSGPCPRACPRGSGSTSTPRCSSRRSARLRQRKTVRSEVHPSAPMPGTFKTEAVVLRTIRYGEADRVLHLYSSTNGRIGAIAKGVRRPKSRFGGRLEPFFRLDLVLHRGRGDLATVTSAHTVAAHASLRSSGPALAAGARARGGGLRPPGGGGGEPPGPTVLFRYLSLLVGP